MKVRIIERGNADGPFYYRVQYKRGLINRLFGSWVDVTRADVSGLFSPSDYDYRRPNNFASLKSAEDYIEKRLKKHPKSGYVLRTVKEFEI